MYVPQCTGKMSTAYSATLVPGGTTSMNATHGGTLVLSIVLHVGASYSTIVHVYVQYVGLPATVLGNRKPK